MLTPLESAMLGIALVFDPLALAEPPKKPLRLSAEQKLYGPLQVTTAVTDVGQTIKR
jgi:hypothetical protein